jgi:hypothetical protein
MRRLRSLLLLAALCAAAGAHGQATTATPAQPSAQRGFFPPTPGDDPSLFHTLPPETYAQPPGAQQGAQSAAQAAPSSAPIVVVVPEPNVESREQLERAQIEAQQAAARMRQAPAPINGAFTGATDEADRR